MLLPLLAASSASAAIPTIQLDNIFKMFSDVCVENTTLADQQKAAGRLPDVKLSQSRGNPKDSAYVPYTVFAGSGFAVDMIGYSDAAACLVSAHIDPTIEAATLRQAVEMRFGSKVHTDKSTKDFYQGSWNTKDRTIVLEWVNKNGDLTGMLSIERRPGFMK